jgi:hypothetical protein
MTDHRHLPVHRTRGFRAHLSRLPLTVRRAGLALKLGTRTEIRFATRLAQNAPSAAGTLRARPATRSAGDGSGRFPDTPCIDRSGADPNIPSVVGRVPSSAEALLASCRAGRRRGSERSSP